MRLKSFTDFEYVDHEGTPAEPAEEEQLDFRLFAAASARQQEPAKIRLRSPTPTNAQPGFIRPSRDISYYLADSLTSSQYSRVAAVAVTGEQVLARAYTPWPGSTYPWKVLLLPASASGKSLKSQTRSEFARLVDQDAPTKRKRLGKKARLKLRTKVASQKRQQEAKREASERKEADEREKRTRRNREKKVKKKLRDKAKKTGATGDDVATEEPDLDLTSDAD